MSVYLFLGSIIATLSIIYTIYFIFFLMEIEHGPTEWDSEKMESYYPKINLIEYIKHLLLEEDYIINSILIVLVFLIGIFIIPILFVVIVHIWPIVLVPIFLYFFRKRLIKQQNKKE